MLSKSRPIVVASMMLLIALALISITTTAQFGTTPSQYYTTQVIMNLLNGQQYFGVPHVYQGDNYGTPTSQWPVYYGPSNASQYWSLAGISSDQTVLELVPVLGSGGAMFWSENYSGGSITITIQATASIVWVGTPFQVYLFLKPTMWGISPQYNYTIPYETYPPGAENDVILPQSSTPYIVVQWDPVWQTVATQSGATGQWNVWIVNNLYGNNLIVVPYPSPHEGDNILPQSSTPYIVVQWEPYWQIFGTAPGATGQWNVWIVNNINGNNPSIGPSPSPNLGSGYAGWDGIGTGAFQPNPGDRINITVTYNPSTNTLTGIAIDLNTGQSANFTLNLGNYYTPPDSGSYVFGVEGITGAFYANWALLYVAMIGNVKSPLPSPTYYSVVATAVAVIVVLVLIIALLMGRRRKQ